VDEAITGRSNSLSRNSSIEILRGRKAIKKIWEGILKHKVLHRIRVVVKI